MSSRLLRVLPGGEEEPETTDRLSFALSILQYNQAFVHFTDGKANSLLLINSIFLATGAARHPLSALSLVAVVAAASSILLCLAVIYARMPEALRANRAELVFFSHIRRRNNPAAYQEDFLAANDTEITESLLGQVYQLSGVVERKFKSYRVAQLITILSAALWIADLMRSSVI